MSTTSRETITIASLRSYAALTVAAILVLSLLPGQAQAFEACRWETPNFASSNSTKAVQISISADKNIGQHTLAVIIYWIDQKGKLQRHGQLYPGQQYSVQSYDGHRWVAKDASDQCQYYTVKADQWNFFHVKYDDGP